MILSPFELMIGGLGEINEQLRELFNSDPAASATTAIASRARLMTHVGLTVSVNIHANWHTAHPAAARAGIRDVNLNFHTTSLNEKIPPEISDGLIEWRFYAWQQRSRSNVADRLHGATHLIVEL